MPATPTAPAATPSSPTNATPTPTANQQPPTATPPDGQTVAPVRETAESLRQRAEAAAKAQDDAEDRAYAQVSGKAAPTGTDPTAQPKAADQPKADDKATPPAATTTTATPADPAKLTEARAALLRDGWEPEDIAALPEAKLLKIGGHRAKNHADLDTLLRARKNGGNTGKATPPSDAARNTPPATPKQQQPKGAQAQPTQSPQPPKLSAALEEAIGLSDDPEALRREIESLVRPAQAPTTDDPAPTDDPPQQPARLPPVVLEYVARIADDSTKGLQREYPQLHRPEHVQALYAEVDRIYPDLGENIPTAEQMARAMRGAAYSLWGMPTPSQTPQEQAKAAASELDKQPMRSAVTNRDGQQVSGDIEDRSYQALVAANWDPQKAQQILRDNFGVTSR